MVSLTDLAKLTVVIRTFGLTKHLSSIECWVDSRFLNLSLYSNVFLPVPSLSAGFLTYKR